MARNTQSVARDFAVYVTETLRRELDNPQTLVNARQLYRHTTSSADADDIIRTILASTAVEVDPDGEIFFRLPKPRRKRSQQ